MKPFITFLIIVTFVFGSSITVFSQNPEQIYQKALVKEEGEGALPEAINLYKQVADNSQAGNSLQAKALLHIGLCYEKLGQEEALKAYQQLVNNFPGEKQEVAIARERLNMLIQVEKVALSVTPKPKFTKINIPTKLSWSVKLSPDGKELALVSDKKLWKMPLTGNLGPDIPGTPVQVNTNGIEVEWSGLDWSGDGKWIAFNEYPRKIEDNKYQEKQRIYIVPSEGGNAKKLIENYRDARVVNYRISLTHDAKKLAFSKVDGNKQHIFSTSVDNVVPRQLVEMEAREPVFSPDGKYIAYVKDKNKGIGTGDLGLWVISTEGGTPYKLAEAGKASSPVWSSDGKMIAFLDYSVSNQISIVPFSKTENTIGKVIHIDAPEGTEEVRLLAGWTPDNKIGALITSKQEFGLYTLPAQGGQAAKILHDSYALQPRWSGNCEQIYYVATPEEGEKRSYRRFLASVSASGGEGKPLKANNKEKSIKQFGFQSGNRVSPDGKWIVTSTWTPADTNTVKVHWPTSKIWKVSVDGKDAIQITHTKGNYTDMSPCWSPDGKKIAFIQTELIEGGMNIFGESRIYVVDSSGSEPELIDPNPDDFVNSLTWSPDGKSIAYLAKQKDEPHAKILKTINVGNNKVKTIGKVPNVHVNIEMAWSPDSKRIAFNDGDGKVIKIMNIDDGSIEDIQTGLVETEIYHLDWSPDGKRFVFGGWKGGNAEFWFLEDFLPLDKLTEKEEAKEPEGIVIKQVWTGIKADNTGRISTDGKYLSFVDWETGNLAIRDLTKGTSQSLTKDGTYEGMDQFAYSSVISPDCKQIAYAWLYNSTYELRLLNIDNPVPKTLYRNENESVFPAFWLSDGKKLIAKRYLSNSGKTKTQIISIDISDGSVNVLKTIDSDYQLRLSPSSDNKYIAYEYPTDLKSNNYDIHLLSINSNYETVLTNHPASDRLLGWMPDCNKVLFTSNRSGSWDLWSAQVENGKLSGLPVRILAEIGEISPHGFTKEGSLYYSIFSRMGTGLVTSFNMEIGIAGQVESKKSIPGSVMFVEWSPDGESVAYGKEEKRSDDYFRKLCVQDLTTGRERCFDENFRLYNNSIRWNSDNQTILAVGYDETKRGQKNYFGGIYTFDTKTSQMNEILLLKGIENEVNPLYIAVAEWSSDAKSIFYVSNSLDGDQTENRITKYVLKTGEEKVIYKGKHLKSILRLSQTSDNLLFAYVNPENKKVHICTIPSEGGNAKEICASQETDRLSTAVWSPDGKNVFFAETPTLDYSKLWRVYSDGGKPQYVCQLPHLDICLSIHPSGQKVALTYGDQTTEIRKIENLEEEVEKIYSQNE